ncbi:MAG: sigma-54 dependent transcriptional regulator [Archangium sp.]|nr:sigma-54 dependent transcriptional regulator [Archangium sp.]
MTQLAAALRPTGSKARGQIELVPAPGSLVGSSPVMSALRRRLSRAAVSECAVLVQGESGTGKELIARALHETGPRASGPFVIVDCGALSPGLVASELFGHERGAFTGADGRHIGAFERADGGTLLLDEVGELPLQLQASLLGALERKRFRRVGGAQELSVDVRVVAATHRALRDAARAGRFRLDLFYRLAIITVEVPPLRARLDDLEELIAHFLGDGEPGDHFADDMLRLLRAHPWPGNVRELRNLVEATVAMGEVPRLEAPPPDSPEGPQVPGPEVPYGDARARVLEHFERCYFERLLAEAGGNVSAAARRAQMDRTHLSELLHRHRLRGARPSPEQGTP